MRYLLSLILSLVIVSCSTAQSGTEVYLFDLTHNGEKWSLSNPKNVSQNEGYDNQPSFSSDGSILYFASNRNGETDLVAYTVDSGEKIWITNTSNRSEYSPTITPDEKHISFITLSTDGIQEFRKINLETGVEELIEDDPIIGYFVWINETSYLCFVLATDDQPSTLQIHNIQSGEKNILGENPGRSFHQIPGSKAVSFIQSNEAGSDIFAFYFETDSSELINPILENSQDMAWLPNGEMIMGSASELFLYSNDTWNLLASLSDYNLKGITRISVNIQGTKIAVVTEE